jgi:hypothetical protein
LARSEFSPFRFLLLVRSYLHDTKTDFITSIQRIFRSLESVAQVLAVVVVVAVAVATILGPSNVGVTVSKELQSIDRFVYSFVY